MHFHHIRLRFVRLSLFFSLSLSLVLISKRRSTMQTTTLVARCSFVVNKGGASSSSSSSSSRGKAFNDDFKNQRRQKVKRELSETHDAARKMLQRGGRLMDRLKSLELGATLAIKRNDETQLRQVARDRVVVKESLKELVRKIEQKRALAETLEKQLDEERNSYLPYETEEEIEEKFRKLERQQERLKVDWLENL